MGEVLQGIKEMIIAHKVSGGSEDNCSLAIKTSQSEIAWG